MLTDDELWNGIERLCSSESVIESLNRSSHHTIISISPTSRAYTLEYGKSGKPVDVDFWKVCKMYSMLYESGSLTNSYMEEEGHALIDMAGWNRPGSAMLAVIPVLDPDVNIDRDGLMVGLSVDVHSEDDRFGLLVRMNPDMYKKWKDEIPADGSEVDINWRCVNLKVGSVPLMTPVFVLGTKGVGFVAEGCTMSDIRMKEGTPDSWSDADRDKGGPAPRILLKLQRNMIPLARLRASTVEYLVNRQGTFSWLTEDESLILEDLLG